MKTVVTNRYITRNDKILGGEPIIKGTRISVRTIVEYWRLGMSPEEICIHLPPLRLAQVFDALSYYDDNPEEINEYIKKNRVTDDLIDPEFRESS